MRIDGKAIAADILTKLQKETARLKEKHTTPHLVIVLIGDDPASESYVRQKVQKGEAIGAKVTVYRLDSTIQNTELIDLVQTLNDDSHVHGIIVQRPLPSHINGEKIDELTKPEKDIDAFKDDSPYTMPLAAAVLKILEYIYSSSDPEHVKGESRSDNDNFQFPNWLQSKSIVVIGKGKTGGGPTIEILRKMNIPVTVIDSKTENPQEIKKKADIVISAVGKSETLKLDELKKGVILVGVGMHKETDGKIHGDYDEEEIQHTASFYTPIPGGVGPVNVAMLLGNLLEATKKQTS